MNLLVIISNPKRASFRQRIAAYLDILRQNGINCEVVRYPPGSLARHKVLKRCTEFDAVYLHKKTLNFLDALWLRHYTQNVIYDFDDAIMYYDEHPERKPSRRKHTKPFERTVKLAKLVIAGNSYLAEHARKSNLNVEVLPTGIDIKTYNCQADQKNDAKIRLVWIGSKSTLPYLAEIKPVLEEIGSRFDNVVLRIICDEFFDLQNMKVEKRNWSLETQAADLATSNIGLAPLPDNRFTKGKCGFKVLQYQAACLPVVTSPVGVNTEYVIDEITGYHAHNPSQWIDRISKLINNAELRKHMGTAGRKHAEHFDTDLIGKKLYSLISKYIKTKLNNTEATENPIKKTATPSTSKKKTVSICIPTYNRKEYLKETIDSILAQTYKDYEIVIVDDGSTDRTEDMIKQLGIPVTYHWQQNSGDAAARNKLIELAQGEYISFIDSDDLLLPDAIERMVKTIKVEDEDVIVYGSYFRIDKNGNVYSRCKRKLRSGYITKYLFQTVLVHACGSMFPKRILKNSTAFDTSLKICSDYEFWLRLSTKYRFVALPEPTFKRRRHLGNFSTASFENCLIQFKVLERFYYEKGGDKVIPEKIAIKVLSIESRRAGRYAIKEGLYNQACELLGRSSRLYPNPKSLILWTKALMAKRLLLP